MNIDKVYSTEKISQIVGLIAEGVAVGTLFVTILIFVGRFTTCIYFGLPIIYHSLNLLKVIPIGIIIFFGFTYSFVVSDRDFFDNTISNNEERQRNSDEVQQKKITNMKESHWFSFLAFLHKVTKRKVHKTDKSKGIITKLFDKWNKKTNSRRETIKLFSCLFLVIVFTYVWMYLSQVVLLHGLRCLFYCGIAVIIALFFYVTVYFVFYQTYLFREVRELLKKQISADEKKNDESKTTITTNEVTSIVAYKTVISFTLVICMLITSIFCSKIISLSLKEKYEIVEININNDEDSQRFAIVLDLEDYYVLEPIREMKDELGIWINSNQFMLVDKDNVLVTIKSYPMILIDRGLIKD